MGMLSSRGLYFPNQFLATTKVIIDDSLFESKPHTFRPLTARWILSNELRRVAIFISGKSIISAK